MSKSNEHSKWPSWLKERKRNDRIMKEQQNCWSDDPGEIQHPTDQNRPVLHNTHLLSTTCADTSLTAYVPQKPCCSNHAASTPARTDAAAVAATVEADKEQKTECHPTSTYWFNGQDTSPRHYTQIRQVKEIFNTFKENINSEFSTIRCEQSSQTFHLGPILTSSRNSALVKTPKMKDRNEK